jgi:outer membrane lipoprotein-sorting protein
MKKNYFPVGLLATGLFLGSSLAADLAPAEIIRRFASRESEFKQARQAYTYRTRMIVQILDGRGNVAEERRMLIETYFTGEGKREQRTLEDEGRLQSVMMTQEDIDDAANIQPFVLTAEDLPAYNVEYLGKEKADELDTYAFSIKPKHIDKGKRYFEGKIWVDDRDLQIVKSDGRAVPQTRDNKFPRFETIRQVIDKKYWFPVWTMADEQLTFSGQGSSPGGQYPGSRRGSSWPGGGGSGGGWPGGGWPGGGGGWPGGGGPGGPGGQPGGGRPGGYSNQVHIREIITYEDYKKFEVKANIKFGAATPESTPATEEPVPPAPEPPRLNRP